MIPTATPPPTEPELELEDALATADPADTEELADGVTRCTIAVVVLCKLEAVVRGTCAVNE